MVVDSSSVTAGMAFFFTIWGANLSTDCFRTCRAAFARISGNIYAENLRKLRACLGVVGNRHNSTTNWEVLPRIFKELGLFTRDIEYKHDANAQNGDGVQYGWHRLPCKSRLLAFFAYLEITHYVDMPSNGKPIYVVGPQDAVDLLIQCANESMTSKLSRSQKRALRKEFGMGPHLSKADQLCLAHERRILLGSYLVSVCLVEYVLSTFQQKAVFAVAVLVVTILYVIFRTCRKDTEIDTIYELEEGLLEDYQEVTQEQVHITQPSFTYMTVNNQWYESAMQAALPNDAEEPMIFFKDTPQLYVVPLVEKLVESVIKRVHSPEGTSLHVVQYNPMTDLHLPHISHSFKKGVELENLLLVFLPTVEGTNDCLQKPPFTRTTLDRDAQFVTTEMDLEFLLFRMQPGVALFPKLVFILPTDSENATDGGKVWKIYNRVLRPQNCTWVSTEL